MPEDQQDTTETTIDEVASDTATSEAPAETSAAAGDATQADPAVVSADLEADLSIATPPEPEPEPEPEPAIDARWSGIDPGIREYVDFRIQQAIAPK